MVNPPAIFTPPDSRQVTVMTGLEEEEDVSAFVTNVDRISARAVVGSKIFRTPLEYSAGTRRRKENRKIKSMAQGTDTKNAGP